MPHNIDTHRRLCIRKDLIEVSQWIDMLTHFNAEIEQLKTIEKQLLKSSMIETTILGIRRKNTLVVAALCQYEKELTTELEYGTLEYTIPRAKHHEKKRDVFMAMIQEQNQLKSSIYNNLIKYERR